MTVAALSQISPELVNILQALNERELRTVAAAACALAVHRVGLDDLRAQAALQALEEGHIGDGPVRHDVHMLTEELDIAGWNLQDQIESGHATDAEYREAFARARAAAALDQALGADPVGSTYDAIYEAYFAVDDLATLLAVVRTARNRP